MAAMDRRSVLTGVLCWASAGLVVTTGGAEAMPFDKRLAARRNDMIAKVQVVVVGPRRPPPRRRRWVCWWHRGRRVCGWRWV
jgi:hypothetical protein